MNLKEQNVLIFPRTMGQGGTENVVLQICEILQPLVNRIIVCSCGGVNVDKLTRMGIKHYEIPDIEGKSLSTLISVSKRLLHIVKTENITIIHTHHRMAAFYVSLLGLYKKCYFLNTAHNTFYNKKLLTKFAYKHANIVACGEMVKKNLVEFFALPDEQVTVIHNAVKPFAGPVVEDPLIKKLRKDGCFIIGNIGRLSEQKGMEYYIQAVPDVLQKHPEARFLIIGSGEREIDLRNLVKQLGIEEAVYFTGYRSDIQNLMSQLDLVVLSSLWEGLPLTPIEAFSVGKTIVATAVDGTVEIVEDGKSGILVHPTNSQEIAEKISWMIEHPKDKKIMESFAASRFENVFSFSNLRDNYMDYYKSLE